MDIVSHGLWGSLAFGRKNKRSFLLAFFFGITPDLFSFGPFFIGTFLGIWRRPPFSAQPPAESAIPSFVHMLYGPTHSVIIFSAIFLLIWLVRKKPLWEMAAWGFHILYDIPLHTEHFFPTPFLWPLSSYTVDGWNWGAPWIFFPNISLLTIFYFWFFIRRRRYAARDI